MAYDIIRDKFKAITKEQIYQLIDTYFVNNEKQILDKIKQRMKRGVGVYGGIIGTYRSRSYELMKAQRNPLASGDVDLFLTGDLYEGMEIYKTTKDRYMIFSNDWKYEHLAKKYGKHQFGVTSEQHDEIMTDLMLYLLSEIISKIYK